MGLNTMFLIVYVVMIVKKSETAGHKHFLETEHASSSADFLDLNINPLRNKFEMLEEEIINDNTDVFLISEIKLGSSFPSGQLKGYSTHFRVDRNQNVELYAREDIRWNVKTSNETWRHLMNFEKIHFWKTYWKFSVEINLKSRKWLLSCSYNLKTNLIADHLHCICR